MSALCAETERGLGLAPRMDSIRIFVLPIHEPKEQGLKPALTKSRWLLLRRSENLTKDHQDTKLKRLVKLNLTTIRSYLLKKKFKLFWHHVPPLLGRTILEHLVHKNHAL
uniref:Transposase n=1 Tax=Candidatus Kentrum sp. TUN TaxID=2126343 RepID=A0A450ZPH5_9GAMM|nr:MAG: Transposase [Candidatus Kentron sp. TUN]